MITLQFSALVTQALYMKRALAISDKNAEAALRGAKATEASIEAAIAPQRARLVVKPLGNPTFSVDREEINDVWMSVDVVCRNVGKTSGWVFGHDLEVEFVDHPHGTPWFHEEPVKLDSFTPTPEEEVAPKSGCVGFKDSRRMPRSEYDRIVACWRRSETDPFAGLKLTHPGSLI